VILRVVSAADDLATLGRIVVAAYLTLEHKPALDYQEKLADVASRAAIAPVVAAFTDDGAALGCVTYVPASSHPLSEHTDPEAGSFRMLGVAPAARGRGVGRALVAWCVERARADGRKRVVIHSTPSMHAAHALYARFGFVRAPGLDWQPVPSVSLLGFVLALR